MPLLKRHDAPVRPMIQWGSHALRALNDNKDPGIDLLVREAIQNSADASVDGAYVDVDFEYKKFDCNKLKGILDDPSLVQLKRLNNGRWDGISLEVRDIGTKGLSGPSCLEKVQCSKDGSFSDNDLGNLIRLTQCIGQAQTKQGAGGSFGVGKTVFYRLSMAPVMFYSRFRCSDNKFGERLIFCFFEDQTKKLRLLQNRTGFAWWCERVTKEGEALPAEDSEKIRRILSQLGVKPFAGKETGTSILLPLLRPGGLPSLDCALPKLLSSKDECENYAEYTRVAVQRWYAPRLNNHKYDKGPILRVRVNGRPVRITLPLFSLIQELYNFANTENAGSSQKDFQKITFKINSTFKDSSQTPARIAVVRIPNNDQLLVGEDMLSPSPEIQLSNFALEEQVGAPILALVRKPGMVVSYIREGSWVRGIPQDRNYYTVGILVLNGATVMREEFTELDGSVRTLEEYVRLNEPPAHNAWSEEKNIGNFRPDVFGAMQRGCSAAIKKALFVDEAENSASSKLSSVAAKIAGFLLPHGFGQVARPNVSIVGPKKIIRGRAHQGPSLDIKKVTHLKDGFTLDLEIKTGSTASQKSGKGSKQFALQICAATESGNITAETWRQEVGQVFPFELRSLIIDSSAGKGGMTELNIKLNKCGSVRSRTLFASMEKEKVVITTSKLNETIAGSIEVRVAEPAFMPSIILRRLDHY